MVPYLKAFEQAKNYIVDFADVTREIVHVHIGLLILVLACLILRKPLGDWRPWAVVLVTELLNEAMDGARYYFSNWPWTPGSTIEDIVLTLFWPTVLTLLARYHRGSRTSADRTIAATVPDAD